MPPPTSARPARPPPPPPEGRPGPRRLRRRPDDGHIAGVCAGVAEYFNVDPVLVRIAAVVLLFSGPGFFAYVLAWIFVPAEPGLARYGEPQPPIDRKDRATQIFGIVLLGLGVSVIWGDWWSPLRGWLFPLGLMALGALAPVPPRPRRRPAPPVPPTPPVPPAPPAPAVGRGAGQRAADAPAGDAARHRDPARALDGDADRRRPAPTSTDPTPTRPPPMSTPMARRADATTVQPTTDRRRRRRRVGRTAPPTAPWDVPPSPVPGRCRRPRPAQDHRHRHHRHRHLVGPGVFGVLLIWTGVAWLTGVGLTTGLAVGLVILGLGFVLGSFVGGSRALIFPALLVGRRAGDHRLRRHPVLRAHRRAVLVADIARRARPGRHLRREHGRGDARPERARRCCGRETSVRGHRRPRPPRRAGPRGPGPRR